MGSTHVHLGVLGVDNLALIKFNIDPLPICVACLVGANDWINAHRLPHIT
jgi:hypothetical protein